MAAPYNDMMKVMNPQQQRAFEIYYSMPDDERSIRRLSVMLGKGLKRLERWSLYYKWADLVKERDAVVTQNIAEQGKKEAMNYKSTLLNFWKGCLKKCLETGADGKTAIKINPENISDAEKITRMILLLSGEATDKQQITVVIVNTVLSIIQEEVKDNETKFRIFNRLSAVNPETAVVVSNDVGA